MKTEKIKILLVDDHRLFLEGMSMLLNIIEGIELVGAAENGPEALKILETEPIDLVICDYMMPHMNGIELAFKLKEHYPTVKILMLTSREDAEGIRNAVRAGVKGFISKKTTKAEIEKAIFALKNDLPYYSSEALQVLSNQPLTTEKEAPTEPLSPREIAVLKLIAKGLSGIQIANTLILSPHTVETHRKNLFRKLGVNSTYALIRYALRHGLNP